MEFLPDACSVVAGVLLGAGQLLYVDAFATTSLEFVQHVPGMLSILGLVMLNVVSWETVAGEYANPFEHDGGSAIARVWVFVALCFSFGGLISSLWPLTADGSSLQQQLAGQNALLFASSVLFRAARTRVSDDS
jgi:Uncharacterised protein family (UPF0220).